MQATAVVCDDLRVEINGKLIAVGIYTSDIAIVAEPFTAAQMYVVFIVEGDIKEEDKFKTMAFEVTFPEMPPVRVECPPPNWDSIPPDRTRWTVRFPVRVSPAILHGGRIRAKVIHDKGEINCSVPWITVTNLAQVTPQVG
jgi:hypothetical protein